MIEVDLDINMELVRLLNISFDDVSTELIEQATHGALIPILVRYPEPSQKKMMFVSDKQRRFFFAALRDGRITVPYRRTFKLAGGWQLSMAAPNHGKVVNKTPYARFVQGSPGQAKYHAGNWQNIIEIAKSDELDKKIAHTLDFILPYYLQRYITK